MSYYLRVEGINLGSFILDTNDLATIRGGSLLLLDAMDKVEIKINELLPPLDIKMLVKKNTDKMNVLKHQKKKLKGEEKKKIGDEITELKKRKNQLKDAMKSDSDISPTITKGASWGLFELDTDQIMALKIKRSIIDLFNNDKKYQYATFVIDLYEHTTKSTYQTSRDKVQTLNRWQQLKAPSLAVTKQGKEVCVYDKVTPANDLDFLPDKKRDYVCASVKARRDHGRLAKNQAAFYKNKVSIDGIKKDAIENLELTQDLDELSKDKNQPRLNGKIAFIYIDGNSFGKRQKASESPDEQREFDRQTRTGREKVLTKILSQILVSDIDKQSWFNNNKLRLETLLWGGDEIIWVVPAWQGWWMLNQFYQLADKHIHLEHRKKDSPPAIEPLFHGSAIVFCKHNAPIYRIDSLARSLADGFSKKAEFKEENRIAYQVLESFDHAGNDLNTERLERSKGLTTELSDLLIKAEQMSEIEECVRELKKYEFPRRKIYQIVQSYRDNNETAAEKLYAKLIGSNRSDGIISVEQKVYTKQLQKLKKIFSGRNAFWLHLMELWDYIGLENVTQQNDAQDKAQGGR